MKMHKFLQNKLWRDKAVAMLEAHGSRCHWKRLDDQEYNHQLRLKLIEEAQEVMLAQTQEEIAAELADIIEVVSALGALHNVSWDTLLEKASQKRTERGGFEGRMFVTIAEHQTDSYGYKYCKADAAKYPEIVE